MNNIEIVYYKHFQIHILRVNGEYWFFAKDIKKIEGKYGNKENRVLANVPGYRRKLAFVFEEEVFSTKNREFREWIIKELAPKIRDPEHYSKYTQYRTEISFKPIKGEK